MIEWLDRFLLRSAKVRHLVIIFSVSLLFLLFYFVFIAPVKAQYLREQLNYQSLFADIKLLEQKINYYPTKSQLLNAIEHNRHNITKDSISTITDLITFVSQQLSNSHLALIQLVSQDGDNYVNLSMKFSGLYHHFVNFIEVMSQQNMGSSMTGLTIIEQDKHLIFSVNI
ncbi:hypothetical protein DES39_0199 [Orbus hercynius]|uniref:Uncharacterized protein n=1 Tax=Orbus hercynius TaxID=593135 RepID=A0A495RI52_9GAMM|nr:hypothetical protein [Orbus hercynius]RKS86990.1 hypothetical protein DES39_0199 [Orbus hercynius]